ncbi:MAG: hypothetical protein NZ749_12275 [bacterium]|nr:hypothetical protein [bacterium]
MTETAVQKKLPDTIVYGRGAIAWKTDEARLKIWSSPQRYEWVQYLDAVRNCYQAKGDWKQIPYRYYLQTTSSFAHRWWRENKPDIPRQRFDWLIWGGCERATERKMMVRLTEALLQGGATVGYLVRFGTEEHGQIAPLQEKYGKQLTLIDLYAGIHDQQRRLSACAAPRAWQHFRQINDLLGGDLRISPATFSFFLGGMAKRLLWERVSPYLEYDNLLVRNHFGSIDSVIALEGLLGGKHVVTLQHGVISSMGFFPILADTVVTFGRASAEFMQRMDAQFGQQTGTLPFARKFIPAGSLFDEIEDVGDTFHHRSLLVIDQDNPAARRFYGLDDALAGLHAVVEQCAREIEGITIIYRLHPSARRIPDWVQALQQKYGNVLVSQGVSLLDDLKRSTAAIGLFSGALTIAAACGVPTFFLWDEGWFYTSDLECYEEAFVEREQAVFGVTAMMDAQQDYASWRTRNVDSSTQYYLARSTCSFVGLPV